MYKEFKPAYPKFKELKEQCIQLADQYGEWEYRTDGQVAIQTSDTSIDNWYDGTGAGFYKSPEWERTFYHLQPSLIGTPIDEYIKWLDTPVYRARIMLAKEKGCYSIHQDYSPRLHLPLVTNKQCNFLLTDPLQMFHLPADGKTTWVDTRRPHTFMNGSTEKRLHLVMIVKE
jgi:hypothetical protein